MAGGGVAGEIGLHIPKQCVAEGEVGLGACDSTLARHYLGVLDEVATASKVAQA